MMKIEEESGKALVGSNIDDISSEGVLEQAPASSDDFVAKGEHIMSEVNEHDHPVKNAPAAPEPANRPRTCSGFSKKNLIWAGLGTTILIVVIVLAVVLTREEPPPPEKPGFVYSTGVSLITTYAVEATIRARLARTKITMEVDNALDCSSIHAISLQLPLGTRITSLKTVADDGCTTTGSVQELKEARKTFMDSASAGIPGAYFEAQDSFTHSLQVAIPPLGTSKVELVLEQLLKQRLDEVKFQVPLIPNELVDSVNFDLKVFGTTGEQIDFDVDLDVPEVYSDETSGLEVDSDETPGQGNSTIEKSSTGPKHIKLDIPDARQHNLPKVVSGKFNPGELPDNGLIYTDGRCFEHFFQPSSLDPMPRNFVFLMDTSESMNKFSKLGYSKQALNGFIDSLKEEDSFTIQAFGRRGTKKLWGSGPGTMEEKEEAKRFVNALSARNEWETDLHEALLEGLLRAKHAAEVSADGAATILVILSDGWATRGETNRTKIIEHVYELNKEGTVSIFPLGFQGYADMQLLDAIALTNGGVSAPIIGGKDDYASQISDFLESELGSVLMSDVNVEYFTDLQSLKADVFGETQTAFPVLVDGYEVVVRGLIGNHGGIMSLNASTSAATLDGVKKWQVSAVPSVGDDDQDRSSLCFQSYAHERITQLVRLYDASNFFGTDLLKELVTLRDEDCKEDTFAKCIRAEALALAKEANVVAKGLTAMVTVDNEKCMKLDDEAKICLDGTTPDGSSVGGYVDDDDDDFYYSGDAISTATTDSATISEAADRDHLASGADLDGQYFDAPQPASAEEAEEGYFYPESAPSMASQGGFIPLTLLLLPAWFVALLLLF